MRAPERARRVPVWLDLTILAWIIAVGVLYFLQFRSMIHTAVRVARRVIGMP